MRNNERHVLGGRDAADHAGQPVGTTYVYLRAADLQGLTNADVVRFDASRGNLHLHVVPLGAWPFTVDQRFAPLLVAWFDLADRGEGPNDSSENGSSGPPMAALDEFVAR